MGCGSGMDLRVCNQGRAKGLAPPCANWSCSAGMPGTPVINAQLHMPAGVRAHSSSPPSCHQNHHPEPASQHTCTRPLAYVRTPSPSIFPPRHSPS